MTTHPSPVPIEDVRALATSARHAFEQAGFEMPCLQDFPAGACGDASEMLGQLLDDRDLGQWHYTSYPDIPSHAWLERDGWIVDITADQFNDRSNYAPAQPNVLVTRDRTWHNAHFPAPEGRQVAGMSWFDGHVFEDRALRDFAILQHRTHGSRSGRPAR